MRSAKYIRSWDIVGSCDRPDCGCRAVEVWALRETGKLVQLCHQHAVELCEQAYRDHLAEIQAKRDAGVPLTVGYFLNDGWRDVEVKPEGRVDSRWGGPVPVLELRQGDQILVTDSEGEWYRSLFQFQLGAVGEPPGPLTIVPYPLVALTGTVGWMHVILGNSRGQVVLNRTVRSVTVDPAAFKVLKADIMLGILASFLADDGEIGMRELRALKNGFTLNSPDERAGGMKWQEGR